MNKAEEQLLSDRQVRREARAVFNERLSRLRAAATERTPAQRLSDEVMGKAQVAIRQGTEIAREGRWVFAGVAVGLAAWFARRPLMRGGKHLWDRLHEQEPAALARRLREWFEKKVKP